MGLLHKLSIPIPLLRLSAIFFLIEFVRGAILISYLPKFVVDELDLTVTTVGVAVAAHYVADTATKLGIGYLLDRFPMQRILQSGFLLSFGGLLLLQMAAAPWMLILGSILFGIGASPIWIIGMSSVSEYDRGHQMGVLYMAWLLGLGLGSVVLNFFLDWFHYDTSFSILLGLTVVAWIVSWKVQNRAAEHELTIPLRQQFAALWAHIGNIRPLLPGMILQTLAASMLVPILPIFAQKHLQLTNTQYSFFLMAGGAFAIIGLVPMGRLSDKLGKKWFLVIGFTCFACGLYSITTVQTLWTGLLWAMALGVSYAAVLPAWNALLAQFIPPQQQGMGWGIFSTVEGVGVMIGPVIGGTIADAFGLAVPFWISAALFLLIGAFYMWFPHRLFR